MSSTRILYNARCPICRAEIEHYRKRAEASGAPLVFEDLNRTDLGRWSLSADQAKRRMHAALPDGRIVSGVPAFAAIWSALPGMGWMARVAMAPGLRTVADLLYNRVAAPWLYRRQQRREAAGVAGDRSDA
jgi:predicted DCC family thiol-disulfide oxidoreductase YuxK